MKNIFTPFFLFIAVFCFGQNTFKVRTFATDHSYLQQVIQLNDGSYISIGTAVYDPVYNTSSVYVLKTDDKGNALASKAINSTHYDVGSSVVKTSDGGFVVSGNSDSSIQLIKFNANLAIQWQNKYSVSNGTIAANKILQTSDGGFLLAGKKTASSLDSIGVAGCLLKTDANGNLQFAKRYFDYNANNLFDVAATTDGNYAILGGTEYNTYANDSAYIVKIKPDGSVLWLRSLSNSNNNQTMHARALLSASDGGLVVTGEAYKIDSITSTDQTIMVKYNTTGDVAWSEGIATGEGTQNYAYAVAEDKDGGYIFGGELDNYKDSGRNDSSYGYLVKTNVSGALQWTKTYEGDALGYTQFNHLINTLDGGYTACGEGKFLSNGNYVYGNFLYKLNSNFQSCNGTIGASGTIQNFGTSTSITAPAIVNVAINVASISTSLSDTGSIQNVCSNDVLPVHLLSFNAVLQNKVVNVEWKTTNETNSDHFIVERSSDKTTFADMQSIAAKSNSSSVETYAITDFQPMQGTSYYRLKEVDKSGAITYSNIVAITVLANGTIVINPNPVYNNIRVVLQSKTNANISFQITDLGGKILATQKQSVSEGMNTIIIPAASLSKGVYVLKVIENNKIQSIKFLKQ